MIEYRDVTVRYAAAEHPAAAHVSFSATRGRITALVGPNGSGKSTLVRALTRQVPLTSGEVLVDGTRITHADARSIAQRVALVSQREDTTFARRVADYVELGRFPHRGMRGAESSDSVRRAAERAGVADLMNRSTDELSGGEWQRVRIARALAQGGDALVLDEPTAYLDIAHEMQIFEMLATLAAQGVAILLVSHQLNLVARFAEHVVLLQRGSVATAGSPDFVMRGEVLEEIYGWPLVVTRDPAVGVPALVPLRRTHAAVVP